jgi:hypothetical protein
MEKSILPQRAILYLVTLYAFLLTGRILVDEDPKVKFYFSDGFEAYILRWYHYGQNALSEGKSTPSRLRAIMPSAVPFIRLSIASIDVSFTNNATQTTRRIWLYV